MFDQSTVKNLFDYRDGDLIRRTGPTCVKVGDVAGSLDGSGYLNTWIAGRRYLNHRLVWFWHHGYMPENDIDHIDRDKINNRIENLREVSRSCNMRNTGNYSTNKSGVKGVFWYKANGKWRARIKINGKTIFLGYHDDLLEAACHRLAAEQAEGWAGCDSNSPAFQFVHRNINGQGPQS